MTQPQAHRNHRSQPRQLAAAMRMRRFVAWAILAGGIALDVQAADLFDSANAVYSTGNFAGAVPLYRRAAASGGNPTLCYFNLGNAYFQLDSLPQSVVYYSAALAHAPEFVRAHLNLGIAYYSLDDPGACIASLRRVLELQPDDAKALLVLASAYRKVSAYPEAVTTYERLQKRAPDIEDSYTALAEMYRELGDPGVAVDWLSRYPDTGKNRAYVSLLLADICDEQSDYSRSLFYLRRSLVDKPDNKWVHFRIVDVLKKMGNDLLALDEGKRALETYPDFGELAVLTANIAFEHERYDDAERLYGIAKNAGNATGVVGLENVRVARGIKASEGH